MLEWLLASRPRIPLTCPASPSLLPFLSPLVSINRPGGRFFDPIGFSRGDEAMYKKYKQNEIVNGRLAMVANLGFWAQYAATGKGPIQNLQVRLGTVAVSL